ncbi:BT_3987 domain-containing protein [Flavobacterium algicola]|uniref:BT_3987 domain-containing protein n=1 Tax=Flavobacterium algicola TaxID=556529 RepID=UPI001EFD8023|nr:DUF1735 domain-containing protein [Flavobacterium algicola]MCG9792284.1 DUF1735 domain-containing protein [Flavobacterium algicola]
MKRNKLKSIAILLALAVGIMTTSCSYDDFVENEFEYTSVYLPKADIDRTFIIDESLQIGVGVVLGGRLTNNENVEVTFSLNDALVTGSGQTVLPATYYTLVDSEGNPANNKITIPAGKVQGFVYVKVNANYLADPLALGNNYALGFKLENVVKADSILADFSTTVIRFSYINRLFGNYIQNGKYTKTTGGVTENITYPGGITDELQFATTSATTATYNGLANLRGVDKKLQVTIGADNKITIQTATGGVAVTDDGGSTYDPAKREVTLNYSFTFNGTSYKCNDILNFRNRVVDGVNQISY